MLEKQGQKAAQLQVCLAQKLAIDHMPKENPLGLYLAQHRLVLSAVPGSFWTSRLLIPASEPGFTCCCHLCGPPT